MRKKIVLSLILIALSLGLYSQNKVIVGAEQIGRASCRERVCHEV